VVHRRGSFEPPLDPEKELGVGLLEADDFDQLRAQQQVETDERCNEAQLGGGGH
jgi:hypothetical protein